MAIFKSFSRNHLKHMGDRSYLKVWAFSFHTLTFKGFLLHMFVVHVHV